MTFEMMNEMARMLKNTSLRIVFYILLAGLWKWQGYPRWALVIALVTVFIGSRVILKEFPFSSKFWED